MSARITDVAFVIHVRRYTDSKVIIEFLSQNHGKLSGVFRVPASKKKPFSLPQVFCLYYFNWKSADNLQSIYSVETVSQAFSLNGHYLYCGLYINELIQRLVPQSDFIPALYEGYASTIEALSHRSLENAPVEPCLRIFELWFLSKLGYEVNLKQDSGGVALKIDDNSFYRYVPSEGFYLVESLGTQPKLDAEVDTEYWRGSTVAKIAKHNFGEPDVLRAAKKLTRKTIHYLLGGSPLKSRELFK